MVSSRPPAALSLLPAPPSRLPLLLLTAVSLLPLACQTAESSPPGSGSVRPGSDSGSVLSDVSNFTELLTARYAPNGTWSESGVSELAAAVQRAITCHGAHCTGGADPACVPADRLLAQLGPGEVSIQSLCPALLHQSQEPGCLTRLAEQAAPRGRTRPAPAEVWGYGMLFVTIISLSSIFAVLLLPLLGRKNFERLMPGMIGLAVGSLSSSALFHLIPQVSAPTGPMSYSTQRVRRDPVGTKPWLAPSGIMRVNDPDVDCYYYPVLIMYQILQLSNRSR